MNNKIVSPCISICKTDPVTGFCYGCARTNEEKKFWKDENTSEEFGRLDGATGGTNFAQRHSKSHDEMLRASCASGLTVAPRAGSAILFYNLHPRHSATRDYELDWTAWHSGCNVTAGVKWVANVWVGNAPGLDAG